MRPFKKEICVKVDEGGYAIIVGDTKRLDLLDMEDGEKVAVYKLVAIKTFQLNPKLR